MHGDFDYGPASPQLSQPRGSIRPGNPSLVPIAAISAQPSTRDNLQVRSEAYLSSEIHEAYKALPGDKVRERHVALSAPVNSA
jgi:hypothetical protein